MGYGLFDQISESGKRIIQAEPKIDAQLKIMRQNIKKLAKAAKEWKPVDRSNVDSPSHYNQGKIEIIDFLEDQEHLPFHLKNAIKYICRSPFKGKPVEDLEKAIWYVRRFLYKKHDVARKAERDFAVKIYPYNDAPPELIQLAKDEGLWAGGDEDWLLVADKESADELEMIADKLAVCDYNCKVVGKIVLGYTCHA